MIYKILIFLVFVAEIVLCVNVIYWLLCADKLVQNLNSAVIKVQPDIKEVCELSKVISWQIKELSTNFVKEVKQSQEEFLYKHISKILFGILLWKLNIKAIKKLKRSKFLKLAFRGLTALANVV